MSTTDTTSNLVDQNTAPLKGSQAQIVTTHGWRTGGWNNNGTYGCCNYHSTPEDAADALAREYNVPRPAEIATIEDVRAFADTIEASTDARIGVWCEGDED